MTAWKLPLIVAAIAVPVILAFWVGGSAAGVAVGAVAGVAILVVAARQRPRGPIAPPPAADGRRHVLVVLAGPLDEPQAVRRLAIEAGLDGEEAEEAEVLVLAPARVGFLDRWASDVEDARRRAQERLVAGVAALAKAGISAEARVGDEDVVQAVEDQLQSFPADTVVLVVAEDADGGEPASRDAAAATELRARLQAEFRRIGVGGSVAG